MISVSRAYAFEAAHRLTGVPPTHRCSAVHGHNYRVVLMVAGPVDSVTGFVIDFWDMDAIFEPLRVQLDHRMLNDVPGLENPTAEAIAVWIAERVAAALPGLARVTVYENADCWAEWTPL